MNKNSVNENDTNVTLTDLEIKMLRRIAYDLYQPTNGQRPRAFEDTSAVWAFMLETKADGGVFASLKKKGLVDFQGVTADEKRRGDDDVLWLTEAGFAAFLEHCPE